jgi:hypothetical protein
MRCGLAIYITELKHLLDLTGAIGPVMGPAYTMARFHFDGVAHAYSTTRSSEFPPNAA